MDPGSCDCCVWTIAPKKNKRIYFYDFSLSMKFVSRSLVSTTSVLVDSLFIIIIIYFSTQKNCLRCHRRYHQHIGGRDLRPMAMARTTHTHSERRGGGVQRCRALMMRRSRLDGSARDCFVFLCSFTRKQCESGNKGKRLWIIGRAQVFDL